MSGRARYRDFYDISLILAEHPVDLEEVTGYVQQKEIREPITKASILFNWNLTRDQKESELKAIYFSRDVEDQQIEEMIQRLPFEAIL